MNAGMETTADTRESILVVDDDRAVMTYVARTLRSAGFRVLTAGNGIEALDVLETESVNLILTDIAMPRMNGYQLYEQVVESPQWIAIPFIFLTARALDSDIRFAKELGVDDYLTKPFVPEDLLAAVRGKLRRARQRAQQFGRPVQSLPEPESESPVLACGKLTIDPERYRVWMDDQQIRLSAREFGLLECMAHQAGKVVPLQKLVRMTHALDTDPTEAGELLRPLIRSLRRKLGYRAGEMGCIQSVRGVGYRLIPPDSC